MHVHDSAMQALIIFLMVLVAGTGWRILASWLAERPAGKAMSFMY